MKKLNMFKTQSGIVLTDCVVSVIIIVMILGIMLALYNRSLINIKTINKRTEATRIIVNVAENIDGIYYSTFENLYEGLAQNEEKERYFVGEENSEIFNTKILPGYLVYLKKLYEDEEKIKIEIRVEYTISGEKQNISLTKYIDKEGI